MNRFAWCLALVLPCARPCRRSPRSPSTGRSGRGPTGPPSPRRRGLLKEWPKDGPPLAWKANGIGEGMGGVAVSRGRIYTTGDSDGSAWLYALNESDGKQVWKAKIGRGGKHGNVFRPSGPRATPTVDGDRLYILSQHGDLVCFTTDGKEVWRTDYVKDLGGIVPVWGFSESPLVDGDKLICTPGAEDGTLMALDKKTGKPIWKCKVPEGPTGDRGFLRQVRGGLRLGHRDRLRGGAAVRAAHGDDARRGRGVRRQAAVAVRPGLQHAPDQLLHAGLPRRHGVRRLGLRRGRRRGEAEQGRQGRDHGQGGVLQQRR